ncbi:MAG: hypothetical protein RDV41_01665, partial [Planctomycetota bacterium]|nr:hypothetical protein [Planctomycetota bacterium]
TDGPLDGANAVGGNLTITSGTLAVGANNASVAGNLTNAGTITITSAVVDVNGSFDSTGTIDFGGAGTGTLELSGAVSNFAALTAGNSTVRYNATADQNVRPVNYYALQIAKSSSIGTATGGFSVGVGGMTLTSGTFATGTHTVTVNGALGTGGGTGTLRIDAGAVDANGAVNLTGGALNFAGAGTLYIGSGTPTSFGAFTAGSGTVVYDETANPQNVLAVTYNNLQIVKNAGVSATPAAPLTVNGTLTVTSGTLAAGANNITAAGATTVTGTITATTATLDCNGSFNATGGTVTFTGAGRLQLGGAVTSLGTFSAGTSTVAYDSGTVDQTVYATAGGVIYQNLEITNNTRTATLSSLATVQGTVSISSGGKLSMVAGGELRVSGAMTVAAALSMTGNCTLALESSITFNAGGLLTTLTGGGIKPTITWYNSTRYAFAANSGSTVNINGLNFKYSNGEGLKIVSGVTITDIDNAAFTNGVPAVGVPPYSVPPATTYLNLRLGASAENYDFSGCSFDDVTDRNVTTDPVWVAGMAVTMNQYSGGGAGSARENDRETGEDTTDDSIKWVVTYTWTGYDGATNRNWNNSLNWEPNGIPSLTTDAIIPNQLYDPIVNVDSSVKNLTITTGILTFPASPDPATTLTVYGHLENQSGSIVMSQGTITMSGATAQDLKSGGSNFANLTVSSSSTVSLQSNLTLTSNLNVSAGALAVGSYTLAVAGSTSISSAEVTLSGGIFDANGAFDAGTGTLTFGGVGGELRLGSTVSGLGTFSAGTGTVTYDSGSDQSVYAVTYYNLKINKSAGVASLAAGTTTLGGSLLIPAGTFSAGSATLNVAGSASITGTLSFSTGTATVNGNFDSASGAVSFSGAGLLRLGGTTAIGTLTNTIGTVSYFSTTAAQTVAPVTYFNLTIDKSGKTATSGGSFTANGALSIAAGTFDVAATTVTVQGATTVAAGATLTLGAGTFNANGSYDATGGYTTLAGAGRLALGGAVTSLGTLSAATGSTVAFVSASTNQNVPAAAYHHLEVNNPGYTATLAGNATAAGNLTILGGSPGRQLDVSSYTLGVTGNATISSGGTLSIGTGTVTVGGQFDASASGPPAAAVVFSGAGFLKLGGSVAGIASLTNTTGTVEYTSTTGNQSVVVAT